MSFLTPLYALGLLAIAAPIVFHLIRRTPRGEQPFSSLMFLSPSPPRLTRRSRLDQLLLLLLRATALGLLALAFARPFLRAAAQLDLGDSERQRVALLIDTSASLRRGDLWPRARALAERAIDGCRPGDQLALFAFDDETRPLLTFAESSALDPSRRGAVARGRLAELSPGWGATNLGQALIDALAAIEDVADATEKAGRMPRRVVLIGDLQQGSRLDALGDFEWPSDVELELKTVSDNGPNASLQSLDSPDEADREADTRLRVRVANQSGTRDRFALRWIDANGSEVGPPIDVYVPPGESRVVRVPRPAGPASYRALRLTGDAHPFDNTLYFADEKREEATVLFVGDGAADDPAGLLYYLRRVFPDTPRRVVHVVPANSWDPARPPALVIVAGATTPEVARRLRQYAQGGGTVLVVVNAPGRAESLAEMAAVAPWDIAEAALTRDVLLGEIAFDHPLFAPLAGPQFNDFTKIHFWKYRRLDPAALGEARVLARFENGDAAVIEKALGKGRLVVLASGWQPADSQLARSSKFVPLMSALLERGQAPPLDPSRYRLDRRPGIYNVNTDAGPRSIAVNLDPAESKTAPLHVEALEQLGCRLASPARKDADRERLRQLRNAELEGRQKLWRGLILAAFGILLVETWLAGRSGGWELGVRT